MKKLLAILFVLMCNVGLFGQVTPIFPSRAVTDADMWVSSDMCSMKLAYPLGPTDTTIQVTTAVGCPTANFLIKIEKEVVGISSVSGVTLSVATSGRGYGGTIAAGHARGQIANMGYFSYQQNRDSAEIESLEAFLMTGTGTAAWGHILGTLTDQGDLVTALSGKQATLSTYATISGLTGYPSSFPPITSGDWTGTWQTHAPAYFEPALGNPGVGGYVLSSTTGGTRSWVAQSGGGGGSLPVVAFNPNTATSLSCPGTEGAQFKASTTLTGASAGIATVSCTPATGTAVTVQFIVSQGATVYALTLPIPFNYCDFTKMGINDTMTQVGTYDGTVYRGGSCDVASGTGNVATTDELPASVTGIRKSAGAGTTDTAAAAADVYGLWSGTKDSSHCMAGDGTMQTCTGGGGGGGTGWPVASTPIISPSTGSYLVTQTATASCASGTAYYCVGTLGAPCASNAVVTAYSVGVSIASSSRFQAQCRDAALDPSTIAFSDLTISAGNGYTKGALFTFNVHPASSLTAFPNLIRGTYAQLADVAHGGYVQHATTLNGQTVPADLIFTSDPAGSALLSWEIESWNNATGAIVAWVKDDRSSSTDTLIYAWVGKSSVTTYQCTASATWNSNIATRYGMADNAASTTVIDSTANSDTGTWPNADTSTNHTASGQVDGALVSSVSTDYMHSTNATPATSVSFELWFKPTNTGGQYVIVQGASDYYVRMEQNSGHYRFAIGSGSGWGSTISTNSSAADSTNWTHLVGVHDGSAQKTTLYINGVADANLNGVTDAISAASSSLLYIGKTL